MLPISDFKIIQKRNNNVKSGGVKLKLLITIASAVSILFFTQLVFANNLATDGYKLSQIEEEIQNFEASNTSLKLEIAKNSSLSTLSYKALQLGFDKPMQVVTP